MKRALFYVPVAVFTGLLIYLAVDAPNIASRISYSVAKARTDAIRENLPSLSKNDYMSALFAQVAESVKPSVVEIRVTKRVAVDTGDIEQFLRRLREQHEGLDERDRVQPPTPNYVLERGLGSGVVVDAANGYILTNNHVVAGADEIEVVLWTGRTVKVEWARYDPPTDLALLKVNNLNAPAVVFGDSDGVSVGDLVLAVGAPEGLSQTVTAGIISARDRSTCDINACRSFLQTDAAINRGNSGGPLVNLNGRVIGIASAIVSESGGSDGLGLAIPSNVAKRVMAELIDKGKVTRGYIGVAVQNVNAELVEALNLPSDDGALVSWVVEKGPADKAGLMPGDFMVAVNGQPIGGVQALREGISRLAPGDEAKIEFYRQGKKKSVEVGVVEQEEVGKKPATAPDEPAFKTFGLTVSTPDELLARRFGYHDLPKGVIIIDVAGGSEADFHRLRPGMIILQAQGKKVATSDEFADAVAAKSAGNGATLLVVDSAGNSRFVFLRR